MNNIKLCIGIPTNKEYCLYRFFTNFLRLDKPGTCQTFIYDDQPVSKCRNKIVQHSLTYGATHLLFLDDDMVLPENAINILLGYNKDIVGLLAFKKKEPFLPVIYKEDPLNNNRFLTIMNYEKGLISVATTGCACLMIKMDVFRKMKFPWFNFTQGETPDEVLSEDFYFCRKAKELGYQIYVDTNDDHSVGHLGVVDVTYKVFEQFKKRKYGDIGRAEIDRFGNVLTEPVKVMIE